MIVHTMTESELTKEVMNDMFNAFRWEDVNSNKFRRVVIKATRFPVYSNYKYTSPRKNKWLILLEARSKKEFGDFCRTTYVTMYDSPHGMYAVMVSWVEKKPQLIIYPPHFFARFRDRFSINATGQDLMLEFFKYNSSYVYEIVDKHIDNEHITREVYGSCTDGVCLGFWTSENNIMFKTFVTYDMLKGEQISKFTNNEKYRQEIHNN